MTCQEQRFPNEILSPILQYSAWERSKSDQLGIMLLSSAAFESVSWVLYHDIILIERVTESAVQNLASCMEHLGTKYFAHRVRALWIDIRPVDSGYIEDQYPRASHLPFIISTCRNIRHLRLFASADLDSLLQSALARPKLESLTLSVAFFEPIRGISWDILLARYPTPALNSVTHFTIELPMGADRRSNPKFLTRFTKLTHACFHMYRLMEVWPAPFMPNLMRKRSLEQVVFLDRLHDPTHESYSQCESMWRHWASSVFWGHGRSGYQFGHILVHIVPDAPVFGTLEEWRSLVLVKRFPELDKLCVWKREPLVKV
ncbi:hypothetical protein DL96DRAFT_1821344, partial [Flagelloscypha sp. PMI_526]